MDTGVFEQIAIQNIENKAVVGLENILTKEVLQQLIFVIQDLKMKTETIFLDFGKVSGVIFPNDLKTIYDSCVIGDPPKHRIIIFNVLNGDVALMLRRHKICYCDADTISEI